MSLISQILKKLAPRTPSAKRERFVPFLEEAVERYQINTELRLAAFLATCCFESDYFKTTVEYRASSGRAKILQDKYWHTGFYGRGLIQLTHERNYRAFLKGLERQLLNNFLSGGADSERERCPDVVKNPDAVAEPKWAVESACWFWQSNNLNKYADKGQFFAIQGLVNRGDAKKKALDYETRLSLYDAALRAIPDDFSAAAPATQDPPAKNANDPNSSPNEAASKPSDQQQNIFNRTTDWIADKRTKLSSIGVEPGSVSKSSAATTLVTKLGGWLLTAWGFVTENPAYFIIGGALIIVAIWYFSKSKDRATARMTNPVNQQNVIVEAK